MPHLISEKKVTARKAHGCMLCTATAIQPGQQYIREVYAFDGRVYTWISCTDCAAIGGEVYEWYGQPDEGVGADSYYEWACEHRDDARAVAYLARSGWEGR